MCCIVCNKELVHQAQNYFARIREADQQIRRLKYMVAVLRSDLTSQNYGLKQVQVKGSSNPRRFEDKIISVVDRERQVTSLSRELSTLQREALGRIKRLPDLDQQNVLIARYLREQQLEEIADELNLHLWQIKRIHKEGLLAFAEHNQDILEDSTP